MGKIAVWYAGFAVYATGVACVSGPGLGHWWGACAASGCALAAVVVNLTAGRAWGRRAAAAAAIAGAVAAPAAWLTAREPAQPDAAVILLSLATAAALPLAARHARSGRNGGAGRGPAVTPGRSRCSAWRTSPR